MKRTLILAAVAATATTSAFAQSSVTIYGRFNTTLERQKYDDGSTKKVMQNNASRIGFRGTEDLGGGLKANFVLEHGFNSATGQAASRFWGREATVGLSGGFGAVRMGNLTASEAYFATADYVSMHNHDTGTSSDAFYALGFNIATGKMSSGIAYTSPTVNGLRFDAQVAAAENYGARRIVLASNYDAGALHLGAGFEQFNGLKSIAIRGLYELGALTLGGYYERDSGHSDNAALSPAFLATDAKRNNFRLSAMYTIGASELHANVGRAGKVGSIDGSDAKQYTLGYNYNLSKRTKVYGFYTKVDESGAAGTAGRLAANSLYGGNFSSLAAGIRHNF